MGGGVAGSLCTLSFMLQASDLDFVLFLAREFLFELVFDLSELALSHLCFSARVLGHEASFLHVAEQNGLLVAEAQV